MLETIKYNKVDSVI